MKFLVDAQLPRRMCAWLASRGHDALHTLDLPLGNRTPDGAVIERADADQAPRYARRARQRSSCVRCARCNSHSSAWLTGRPASAAP
ncbi:MAG: DUF5615 family PIN-like protein [Rubrivivax sp.]|nr:DUF5615 family PIN-like protein [Rubrivivax sp.]